MRDLLLVMNPRRIEECLNSFGRLPVDKLWIKNMKESDIELRWPEVMDLARGYDRLAIVSDDAVVPLFAWEAVMKLADQGHPVVTGYSNLDMNDMRTNLDKKPLEKVSTETNHDFMTLGEVMCWPDEVVPTTLTGFSLTVMSYAMWELFPFQYVSGGSDWGLSKRLAKAGIPIVAARDGLVWHVKEIWNQGDKDQRKRLLIDIEPPSIELETYA